MQWVEKLHDDVRADMKDRSISYETKQYANHRLQQIRPKLKKVTDKHRYEDHLLTHLQEEREKFRISRAEGENEELLSDSPYDEVREDPVCTCDGPRAHACPLKRGELPREVRQASDLDQGIREFRGNHTGNPIVLESAQTEWAELLAEVEQELRDIVAILAADEVPEHADWTPRTVAEP